MDETILAAIAAITKVEEARAALTAAQDAATEALPVLVENGLASESGQLTVAGSLAVQLLARVATAKPAAKASNGNAVRVSQSTDERRAYINAALDADPSRGWSSVLNQYHVDGFACGWPDWRPIWDAVVAERGAAALEAEAAAAKPARSRKVS